jgi:hypothetical protein
MSQARHTTVLAVAVLTIFASMYVAAQQFPPPRHPVRTSCLTEIRGGKKSCWGIVIKLDSALFKKTIRRDDLKVVEAKHGANITYLTNWHTSHGGKELTIEFKPGRGDFGTGNRVAITLYKTAFALPTKNFPDYMTIVQNTDAVLRAGKNAHAQSVNPCDHPNNLPASFFEVPVGPQGDWTAVPLPDPQQSDDPLVPVVVAAAGGIQGPADRRGMRLGCGTLRNRSQKSVTAILLRWILIRRQDHLAIRQNGFSPDTVLIEGHTPAIELTISTDSFRRTDFSIISFASVTQRLTKNGILSGDYFLYVGVHQVLFEDGSVWKAKPVR